MTQLKNSFCLIILKNVKLTEKHIGHKMQVLFLEMYASLQSTYALNNLRKLSGLVCGVVCKNLFRHSIPFHQTTVSCMQKFVQTLKFWMKPDYNNVHFIGRGTYGAACGSVWMGNSRSRALPHLESTGIVALCLHFVTCSLQCSAVKIVHSGKSSRCRNTYRSAKHPI
jgi:hypothetical protein